MEQTDAGEVKAMAFEVKVKEATAVSPFTKQLENRKPMQLSNVHIKQKLDMAEERRKSLKSQVQEQAASELKKAQEISQKAQEDKENWQRKVSAELAADLEAKEMKRLQILEQKKMKVGQRLSAQHIKVAEMKRVLDEASKKLADRIASEQALAEDRRNKQLTQFQERFKEHSIKIAEARKGVEEAQATYFDQLEEKHLEKLDNGLKNRQEQLDALLERLKEHSIHRENVRKNKKALEDE